LMVVVEIESIYLRIRTIYSNFFFHPTKRKLFIVHISGNRTGDEWKHDFNNALNDNAMLRGNTQPIPNSMGCLLTD